MIHFGCPFTSGIYSENGIINTKIEKTLNNLVSLLESIVCPLNLSEVHVHIEILTSTTLLQFTVQLLEQMVLIYST